jgi:uncharacterized protein with PQ loop repeat
MTTIGIPVLAGIISTVIFAVSTVPMLVKAYRSRNLSSYSLGNIALANVGNGVHSIYVYSLPPGPIWALHSFYLTSTALMLVWYLRYAMAVHESTHAPDPEMRQSPDASRQAASLA